MKNNYHKKMLEEIERLQNLQEHPKLLLHSCCAPCSTHVLKMLSQAFDLQILFFNPNIYPDWEYEKRLEEQVRLVKEMALPYKVIGTEHQPHLFYEAVKGFEAMGEGSERCSRCFTLRLEMAAQYAKENGFDYFTTTLTTGPMKNAEEINCIGDQLGTNYGVRFLPSDFKKENGYRNSVDLSKEYNLYRQGYCGCIFSKRERDTKHEHDDTKSDQSV